MRLNSRVHGGHIRHVNMDMPPDEVKRRIRVVIVAERGGPDQVAFTYSMSPHEEKMIFARLHPDGRDRLMPFALLVFESEEDRRSAGYGNKYYLLHTEVDRRRVVRVHRIAAQR